MGFRESSKRYVGGSLLLLVFGLPFLGGGLFACYRLAGLLGLAWEARGWVATTAQLEKLELETRNDGEGTSYELHCRYAYTFGDAEYAGTRVGLEDGAGDEAKRHYAQLQGPFAAGQPVTCYVKPNDPREALLFREIVWTSVALLIPFAVCFTLIGGAVCVGTGRAWLRGRRADAAPQWPAEGVAGVVRPDTRGKMLGVWLFCVLWNGLCWPVAALFGAQAWRGEAPGWVWLVVAFPLIGLKFVQMAVRATLLHRRFGGGELRLAESPVRLGGQLVGELVLPERAVARLRVATELRCVRRVESGESTTDKVIWSSPTCWFAADEPDGETRSASSPPRHDHLGLLTYPLRIAVPASCAPTAADESVRWRLHVTGRGSRPQTELGFEVPVVRDGEREMRHTEDQDMSDQTQFNVVMKAAGRMTIRVIKVVRDARPELGLADAKELVEGAPRTVLTGVSKVEAERWKRELEAAGATVAIE
jgi:ribosomal protein L7/L12